MGKRWILCPGYVTSKNDGDRHFIGAGALAQLYGVRLSECHIKDPRRLMRAAGLPDLPHLYPDYFGKYQLQEPADG